MALDRTSIDKVRETNNLPPISDEEFASLSGNGASAEEKKAQTDAIEAKKKEDELAAAKLEEEKAAAAKVTEVAPVQATPAELSDDELLKIIHARTGRQVKSFDELKPTPTEIDKEKLAEERESDKLSWALKNKKVSKKEFEGFVADSKDRTSVVFRQYAAEALAEDNTLTEEEIKAEFDNRFGRDAKPESREFKRGQKEIDLLADNILKNSYPNVLNIEHEYSAFERKQQADKEFENKVKVELPAYNKVVEGAISKLKKIKAHFTDKEEYEISSTSSLNDDTLEKSISEIGDTLKNKNFIVQKISEGYSPEEIEDIAYTMYLRKNFPLLAKEVGKQMLLKHGAGLQGIPKLYIGSQEENNSLTDNQNKFVDIHKQANPQLAAAN